MRLSVDLTKVESLDINDDYCLLSASFFILFKYDDFILFSIVETFHYSLCDLSIITHNRHESI